MPFGIDDLFRGGLAPALVAGMALLIVRRTASPPGTSRHAAAVAVTAGFLAAWLLFPWTPIVPKHHWHWLPWLAVTAAVVGPAAAALSRMEDFTLHAVLAAAVACAIVPDWQDLEPSRGVQIVALTVALTVFCVAIELLPVRLPGATLPAVLCGTAVATSVLLAVAEILMFAQLAGAVAAALFGCAVASIRAGERPVFRGGTSTCAVLIGGLLYAGWVHSFSDVPPTCYVLVAVAPLMSWTCAIGPAARWPRRRRFFASVLVVAMLLAIALAVAIRAEPIEVPAGK